MGLRGPKARTKTTQVAFRLPDDLLKRLDAFAADMAKNVPGVYVSRADALRVLLAKALDAEEAEKKTNKPEKRK